MTARDVTGFCAFFLRPEIGQFSPHFGRILSYVMDHENETGEICSMHVMRVVQWYASMHRGMVKRSFREVLIMSPGICLCIWHERFRGPPTIYRHHKGAQIKKRISKGVVHELSEPKRTAKCAYNLIRWATFRLQKVKKKRER